MKKILVLTDFSDCANAASEFAIEIAKLNEAEIHFLHLLHTPVDGVKLPKDKEKRYPEILSAIEQAKSKLKRWQDKAKSKNLKTEQYLVFSTEKEAVFRHIDYHHHDFLIMGSHGSKRIKEKIVGSNAQKIIRYSEIPVLIIKRPVTSPVKNILFVSDFTDVSKDSFHTLTRFADILEAQIDLLFINTSKGFKESVETNKNMDEVMKYCNRVESCNRNVIPAASVEEGIKDFILQKPMDLIAICTHGKNGFKQLFSPSIAEKIAKNTILPLLSIKL